jgi:hypothetical protein
MTHVIDKPRYIDPANRAGSASLPAKPPFVFRDVTARVFPVKANPARLYGFCKQYLNIVPPQIAQFRPSIPYVYVMVLNYGRMGMQSATAQNLGWVSQHEVLFTVPLTWWRKEHGRLVFKDYAFVSPFIFVDDPLSLTTGREVYGWPKVAAAVDAEKPLWADHPRTGVRLFSLSTKIFPKTYAGQREQPRVLLQVDRDPIPSFSEAPPDPNNPWSPLSSLPLALRSSLGLMGDAIDLFAGLRLRGYHRSLESMLSMLGSGSRNMARLLPELLLPMPARHQRDGEPRAESPELHIEQITLKQFRDAENPNDACYQALVASTMGFDRLNRGGLLGDIHLLRGDPSGGITLRIHRYAAQPIVESLGMEVARIEEGDQVPIDILKPTLPFWTDVDLFYGPGRVICSRTSAASGDPGQAWRDEQPREPIPTRRHGSGTQASTTPDAPPDITPSTGPDTTAHTAQHRTDAAQRSAHATDTTPAGKRCRFSYNTARGGATQPIAGPFRFPDVTLQVYPLLAERARLARLLQHYLGRSVATSGHRFELIGSYVYMLITVVGEQLGSMWSESNNIGWWADKELSFCLPVRWFHRDELVGLTMLTPFVFANSGRAVITDREVNGRPSVRANIDSAPDSWLAESGPIAERTFLRVATEVFPALHLGQESQQRTLIEIDGRDSLRDDDAARRKLAEHWRETLVRDQRRKDRIYRAQQREVCHAKALARQILAQQAPVNWITLKQYPDAEDPGRACYQALVHTTRSISALYDLREIEQRVHVRLHRYPGQPIADTLGLAVKHTQSRDGVVVDDLQPVRPFWMRLSMEEALGRVICARGDDGQWTSTHPWFARAVSAASSESSTTATTPAKGKTGTTGADTAPGLRGDGLTSVGAELGRDRPSPQRLRHETARWLEQALTRELTVIFELVGSLSSAEREAVQAGLEVDTNGQHAHLFDTTDPETIAASLPADDLLRLVDLLTRLLGDRLESIDPPASGRLSRGEARASLRRLDELQVVIEAILSDGSSSADGPGGCADPC